MSIVKHHKKLGTDYPEVVNFFEGKAEELDLPIIPILENLTSLDIYIMDGILFDDNGMVYAQLFDGDEIKTKLTLLQQNEKKTFRVPYNRPMILLSNYGDEKFIEATIVHEVSHFVKNFVEKSTPDHSPDGRDEQLARDFEEQYLEWSAYQPEDLANYMQRKYLPNE